jgi:hypothetical protein
MPITAAPILAMFIGALILLLPDWAVLEIPGVVRIEKQVKEQAQRQDEILRLIQNINLSQKQQITIEIAELVTRVVEKGRNFESDDT